MSTCEWCKYLTLISSIFSLSLSPVSGIFGQERTDERIQEYLREVRQGGLVVSQIRFDTFEIQAYGRQSKAHSAPPSSQSRFEIGAVSQVFSGLLLMIAQSEELILPESDLQDYFPEEIESLKFEGLICTEISPVTLERGETPILVCRPNPVQNGSCMSFCELILHNSGLPLSLEEGFNWNPFAHMDRWEPPRATIDRKQFFEKLNEVSLIAKPGNMYYYSNIGPALLGQLLAEVFDQQYEVVLQTKIFEPLGLKNTGLGNEHLLPGHNHKGKQVPPLQLNAQIPAAGLRSDAVDLSRLILQFLNPPDPDWEFWIASATQDRIDVDFPTAPDGTLAGYGWFSSPLSPGSTRRVVWQYGGTAGHRTFVAFVPRTQTGLVLLTNQPHDLKELGFGLIREMQSSSRP